jgi:hypothetical protein
MSVFDEMLKIDRTDKDAVLAFLGREVTPVYMRGEKQRQGVIVVESIMGRHPTGTITFVWEWFMVQQVFNKIIIVEMNDHTVTFDKNIPRVKK